MVLVSGGATSLAVGVKSTGGGGLGRAAAPAFVTVREPRLHVRSPCARRLRAHASIQVRKRVRSEFPPHRRTGGNHDRVDRANAGHGLPRRVAPWPQCAARPNFLTLEQRTLVATCCFSYLEHRNRVWITREAPSATHTLGRCDQSRLLELCQQLADVHEGQMLELGKLGCARCRPGMD